MWYFEAGQQNGYFEAGLDLKGCYLQLRLASYPVMGLQLFCLRDICDTEQQDCGGAVSGACRVLQCFASAVACQVVQECSTIFQGFLQKQTSVHVSLYSDEDKATSRSVHAVL